MHVESCRIRGSLRSKRMPLILNQKIRIVIGALLLLSLSNGVYAQSTAESPPGFYKDLFMSSGVNLSSRRKLFAAESLGLSYEYYAGKDASIQNRIVGIPQGYLRMDIYIYTFSLPQTIYKYIIHSEQTLYLSKLKNRCFLVRPSKVILHNPSILMVESAKYIFIVVIQNHIYIYIYIYI